MKLYQDKTWRGERLEDMSTGHRVNTLAYIRRHAGAFQNRELAHAYAIGAPDEVLAEYDRPADQWVEDQPLVRRLVELTARVGPARHLAIKAHNKAYEIATGYRPQ